MAEETKINPPINKEQASGKIPVAGPLSSEDEGDSVLQDVGKLKAFFKKLGGQAKTKSQPYAERVKPAVESVTSMETKERASSIMSSFTKIAIFVVIIFTTLLLTVIGFSIFQKFGQNSEPTEEDVVQNIDEAVYINPTIIPYKPSSPSVYASDTVILKMEEDIKILESEMFSIPIRESTLYPPALDFNINFGTKK